MIVNAKPSGILSLGREGENQARSIRFDISHWVKDFGPGVVELVHQRSGDPYPYPVVVSQTENEVLWNITATDTAMVGLGRCELQFYLGGVLAKSENWFTKVFDSISASGDVIPDPEVSWVTEVIQAGAGVKEQAARAEAAAEKAEAATVNVPILGENGNWFVWDKTLGEYVDTGVYSGGDAPHIGENGNWYVGQTDTGVSATGPAGPALAVSNTAAIGQTIRVSAVDDAGKPTEWEAVDMEEQVQADWNQNDSTAADYVKNRPFYDNLLVRVPIPGSPDMAFYKVSDSVPTGDCSDGASATIIFAGEKELVSILNPGYGYYLASEFIIIALEDNVTVTELGLTFPGKGTYFVAGNVVPLVTGFALGADADPEITWDGNIGELKKLDEKFLPENVATKSDVEVAQATADNNKEVISDVFSTLATFTFDKQTEGRDTFVFNAFDYYKISDFNPDPLNVISFEGTRASGHQYSTITAGNNCTSYGFFIVVASAGNCSLPITDTVTGSFIASSAGLYARYRNGNPNSTAGTGEFTLRGLTGSFPITGLLLKSSTADSTKKFRITVDDSGTLSTTEVT